jgi:hypothetical protein
MSVLKNIKLFKNIFITSGITFIFGIYSIYHLYFYIQHIEYTHNAEITKLQKRIYKIENDYNDLKLELVDKIENSISKIEQTHLLSNDVSFKIETNNYLVNELEHNDQINAIKKIDYTCIDMDNLFETDSDDYHNELSKANSIPTESCRSRSKSWSSFTKRVFG